MQSSVTKRAEDVSLSNSVSRYPQRSRQVRCLSACTHRHVAAVPDTLMRKLGTTTGGQNQLHTNRPSGIAGPDQVRFHIINSKPNQLLQVAGQDAQKLLVDQVQTCINTHVEINLTEQRHGIFSKPGSSMGVTYSQCIHDAFRLKSN